MGKMGRPLKPFDWSKLDALLQYGPTLEDTAAILNTTERHIERVIRSKHKMTFVEYREKKKAYVRTRLKTKAIALADAGNVTMLIFCLKNLCGWGDSEFKDLKPEKPFIIEYQDGKKEIMGSK